MLHNLQKRKRDQKGFTIIEVLIVLAIAGLIMLVVFLAIPALQRNSHNTQRKNDVSALIGAVQEYEDNNGGALPGTVANITANAKLGFYNAGTDITYGLNAAAQISPATWSTTSKVYIETFAKCATATTLDGNPTSRNAVAWYFIEVASGAPTAQCEDV